MVSPLGSALSTLVKWRDAFAAAAAALQPVFDAEAGSATPEAALAVLETPRRRQKALPTSRADARTPGDSKREAIRMKKAGSTAKEIAAALGISPSKATTLTLGVKRGTRAGRTAAVVDLDEEEPDDEEDPLDTPSRPAPQVVGRRRFTVSAPRRCATCSQTGTQDPCENCGASR